jgi:hypothetical protein
MLDPARLADRNPCADEIPGSSCMSRTGSADASGKEASPCTLAFGPVVVALASDDPSALHWLEEYLGPWFAPTSRRADWHVRLWSSRERYEEASRHRPPTSALRACFAFDQEILSLPTWTHRGVVTVDDPERSCLFEVVPFEVDLFGDPDTRRWRFTAARVVGEVAATRLRRTELDLHSAAVEASGRALLIVGPKGAGKTTLSLYLLRSGGCRALANDRVFASVAETSISIRGVPTAVKIRSATAAAFPELRRGLERVERPYLHSLAELAQVAAREERVDESVELALSPPQLLRRLGVAALASAPLGAIVFPRVEPDLEGWAIEPLSAGDMSAGLAANLYGNPSGRREPTLFEEIDGGAASVPLHGLIDHLSRAVPGYRVLLGRKAYASGELAARLVETLGRS